MEDGDVLLLFLWRDRDGFHVNQEGLVVALRQEFLICLFLELPCTFQAHILVIARWGWLRTFRIFLFFLSLLVQLSQINYLPANLFQGIVEDILFAFPRCLAWDVRVSRLQHFREGLLLLYLCARDLLLHLYKSY